MPEPPNQPLIDQLVKMYGRSAARLKTLVLNPPGITSRDTYRAHYAALLNEVNAEVATLKQSAANWTGAAIQKSTQQGIDVAMQQIKSIRNGRSWDEVVGKVIDTSYQRVDTGAMRILAQDTITDLSKGADGMARLAQGTLNKLTGLGVTKQEVNDILANRLAGSTRSGAAIRELRDRLIAVNGEKVSIPCKDGVTREYDADYYAEMIGRTKTRQAIVEAKHQQFDGLGIDLVRIVGRISPNFCTAYVGHIYSRSGTDPKYPPLASLRVSGVVGPGPPFHPNCSKSDQPYVASSTAMAERIAQRIQEINARRAA